MKNFLPHKQVFINPTVASLEEHAHLLSEPGCVDGLLDKKHTKRLCSGASDTLPQEFNHLTLTAEMDMNWEAAVLTHLEIKL